MGVIRRFLAQEMVHAIAFSLKAYAAALLAYYSALCMGQERPYWAFITAYIVSNPLSGAALSKGVFRLIGTVVGAGATVFLLPVLVNAPALLCLALALWLALGTYLGTLDGTGRGYIFLLAGYTASIIGFASVDVPGNIFTVASLRVQEISFGIVSATLIHTIIFPQSVTARILGGIDAIDADVNRRSRDVLDRANTAVRRRDRHRAALNIGQLHQLTVHLPFDTHANAPTARSVRALQDQFAFLMAIVSGLNDRLEQLEASGGRCPRPLEKLLQDVSAWLVAGAAVEEGNRLSFRAEQLVQDVSLRNWCDLLELSLLMRLGDMISAHQTWNELVRAVRNPASLVLHRHALEMLRSTGRPLLHRDRLAALHGAFSTAATVLTGSVFWIATAWPDGGTAVLISGVICALFSSLDGAGKVLPKIFLGSLAGMVVAAVLAFGVLPRVTDFSMLALVSLPVFLVVGVVYANPRHAPYALGLLLALPATVGLNESYDVTFESFANSAVAQLIGTALATVASNLFYPDITRQIIRRLFHAAWFDLAKLTGSARIERRTWLRLMLDRVALLDERLIRSQMEPEAAISAMLSIMRSGAAVHDLQLAATSEAQRRSDTVACVLEELGRHCLSRAPGANHPGVEEASPRLLTSIDAALVECLGHGTHKRDIAGALVSLRRNFFSRAAAPMLAPLLEAHDSSLAR